jgi:hypothetical protein
MFASMSPRIDATCAAAILKADDGSFLPDGPSCLVAILYALSAPSVLNDMCFRSG